MHRAKHLLPDQRIADLNDVFRGAPYQTLDQRGIGAGLDLELVRERRQR
jgi:hypothetical protein